MFKTINKPDMDEYNNLMEKTQEWAEKVGMTESDISEAISEVRKIRKAAIIAINIWFFADFYIFRLLSVRFPIQLLLIACYVVYF